MHRYERGQVLPIVALCLTVLFGFAAFAVDAGYLQYQQRHQQTAADAAALAGAWQVLDGASKPQVQGAGISSAGTNGLADNGTTVKVTVNWPPATGPNAGNNNAVEALVDVTHPAFFSSVLGYTKNKVTTRAVAVVQSNTDTACFLVMQKDLTMSAPGSLTANCGILVNRNVHDNNSTMNVPSIGAGGSAGKSIPGVVVTSNIPPFADPCSTVPGCKALVSMYPLSSNVANEGPYSTCSAPTSPKLSPGCFTSISQDSDLAPGLYVITGNLTGNLTCSTCTSNGTSGTGVTLVVQGKINFNGSTTSLVAPPKATGAGPASVTMAGGAPGVLLYQSSTQTNPENFSATALLGMIYAPQAHINLNGGGSTVQATFVVAADVIANKANISLGNGGFFGLSQTPVLSE